MYKIAGQAGIHPTTLSAYSLGYTPIPPLHLMVLSEVLDVPEHELVGELDLGELRRLTLQA
jgi:DNA-binding transcriptional regulator YdaS (Cro superfamily)